MIRRALLVLIVLFPCLADAAPPDVGAWRHAIQDLRAYPVLRHTRPIPHFAALLDAVTAEVKKVGYEPNELVYGKEHYWATEREFVNFGGNCRDIATEKYRLLRRAGVADADMEILVIFMPSVGVHALLKIEHDGETYYLDNAAVLSADELAPHDVLYSMNRIAFRPVSELSYD